MRLSAKASRVLLGVGITITIALVGSLFMSQYTASGGIDRFTQPTMNLLRAGLALDSSRLARMNVSASALGWALHEGRTDPGLLRSMIAGLRKPGVRQNRDSREVSFDVMNLQRCGKLPLTVYFSGIPEAPRIEGVRTDCSRH
jgi:hypothetical protein